MASLVRSGFVRLISSGSNGVQNAGYIGIRSITSISMRGDQPRPPKPAPWDYKNKSYNLFHSFYDKTSKRFDENSKIILVEGPIAAGKTKLAKTLAKEFEMLYLPEANLDMWYINEYGFDLRTLDGQLPEGARSFDVNNFLLNPRDRLVGRFQLQQYSVKFSQYIDALAHLFSTGQGVVLDRSVYSDFVFLEAMYNSGYVSKGVRKAYYDVRKNSISALLRPHLVIYLDVPPNKILKNIKARNLAHEVNSPVLSEKYLKTMEEHYKQGFLTEISKHAELLVYDWSEGGDEEVVVDDVVRIDFSFYDQQDPKMKDWHFPLEEDWAIQRHKFSDKKEPLLNFLNVPCYHVPELILTAEDSKAEDDLLETAPGEQYEKGYDAKMGDTGILTKVFTRNRDTLPLRERRSFN